MLEYRSWLPATFGANSMYNHIAMAEACDQDLVLRARRGESQAFGELVLRYQASVFGVCLRMMGERQEAEDMTQDAFLRAYQRLGTYDGWFGLLPYLAFRGLGAFIQALSAAWRERRAPTQAAAE